MGLQNGVEVTVHALGRDWKIPRQQISALDQFVAWVRTQLADPVERLAKIIDKLPPEAALAELKAAKKEAEELDYLDWDSPQVRRFLPFDTVGTPATPPVAANKRGMAHFFLCLLQINHPGATLDDAIGILRELTPEQRTRVFSQTAGEPRGNGEGPA